MPANMTGRRGRQDVDWERIEADYRAGQLSISEIARRHAIVESAIRKKAKKLKWKRDLTGKVNQAVRDKLLRAQAEKTAAQKERELPPEGANEPEPHARIEDETIIEEAAARGVEVILRHRKDISRLAALRDQLAAKAETLVPGADDIKGLAIAADAVESLMRTTGRMIPLERQAFNLDAKDEGEVAKGSLEDRVKQRTAERSVMADPAPLLVVNGGK